MSREVLQSVALRPSPPRTFSREERPDIEEISALDTPWPLEELGSAQSFGIDREQEARKSSETRIADDNIDTRRDDESM